MIDKKTLEHFTTDLQKVGLTLKEAAVYMALLKLGETGSSKILSETGLHGQFVYQALEGLENRGLAQHVIQRGRKRFSARPPNTLLALIEQQRRETADIAERLTNLFPQPSQQQFEVYQGEEAFVAHEFHLLEQAPTNATLLVVGGTGDAFINTLGSSLSVYEKLRIKKGISVRYIGSEAQRQELTTRTIQRTLFNFRLLPGLFTGNVNTNIWPTALSFNIFSQPIGNFTITNTVVAASYRQFFETLWKLGK